MKSTLILTGVAIGFAQPSGLCAFWISCRRSVGESSVGSAMALGTDDRSNRWSDAVQRAVSVVIGTGYIYLVSLALSAVTNSSLPSTVLIVATCAALEMLIICELSRRLFLSNAGDKRFGLSTLLLVVIALSIYLAGLGYLVRNMPGGLADLPRYLMVVWSGLAILLAALSTLVLTYYAEALLWAAIAVATRMGVRRKERSGVRPPLPTRPGGKDASLPGGNGSSTDGDRTQRQKRCQDRNGEPVPVCSEKL